MYEDEYDDDDTLIGEVETDERNSTTKVVEDMTSAINDDSLNVEEEVITTKVKRNIEILCESNEALEVEKKKEK